MPSSSTHLPSPPLVSSVPTLQRFTPFSELLGGLEPLAELPSLPPIPLPLPFAGHSLISPSSSTPKPSPALWPISPLRTSPDPLIASHPTPMPLVPVVSNTPLISSTTRSPPPASPYSPCISLGSPIQHPNVTFMEVDHPILEVLAMPMEEVLEAPLSATDVSKCEEW
ncbi:hypothetical protein BU17DRAFT_91707 [Hysterangium stoloniferum]|nr:hypothetical protein BU17DRAFT_91707 [Hysterangium stoloniferum]